MDGASAGVHTFVTEAVIDTAKDRKPATKPRRASSLPTAHDAPVTVANTHVAGQGGLDDHGRRKEKGKDFHPRKARQRGTTDGMRGIGGDDSYAMRNEVGSQHVAGANLSDEQLRVAKAKFFEADRDGSGTVDAAELATMMSALGVVSSVRAVRAVFDSVDASTGLSGEKDGKIDMREWLTWYANGLRNVRNASEEDAHDAFLCVTGGDTTKVGLSKVGLQTFMLDQYGIEYTKDEIDSFFENSHGDDVSYTDFCKLLAPLE